MKVRVISAAILLPIVLAAIVVGDWFFAGLITLAVLLAAVEYVQMLGLKGYGIPLYWVWAMIVLWLADAFWDLGTWFGIGIASTVLLGAAWQLFHHDVEDPTATWALTLAGGLYLGIGGAYLLRLRALPEGLWWTLTVLPVVWIADSAAYSVGRRWGVHKIAPDVSPGKSWEGYGAEVLAGFLSGFLLVQLWTWVSGGLTSLSSWQGLFLGGLLAVLTPLGDFFVSMIKREVGVKDSGKLIPGHGGAFDRIDSLLWAGVLSWLFVLLCQ